MHKVPNRLSAGEGPTKTRIAAIFGIALVAFVALLLTFPSTAQWVSDAAQAEVALVAMP